MMTVSKGGLPPCAPSSGSLSPVGPCCRPTAAAVTTNTLIQPRYEAAIDSQPFINDAACTDVYHCAFTVRKAEVIHGFGRTEGVCLRQQRRQSHEKERFPGRKLVLAPPRLQRLLAQVWRRRCGVPTGMLTGLAGV